MIQGIHQANELLLQALHRVEICVFQCKTNAQHMAIQNMVVKCLNTQTSKKSEINKFVGTFMS